MSKPLFCETTESPHDSPSGAIHDAIFQVACESGLRVVVEKDCESVVSDFFCSEVSRCPSNIKNHIRRIWLQYDNEDSGHLFAALLDLWVALNGSGRALFRRLLLGAKSRLEPAGFEKLALLYTSNELRNSEYPVVTGSVLNRGVRGRLDLLTISEGEANTGLTERDPLQEAHECLEYSQIEQAREILENALLNDPLREAIHSDLLDIYKSTQDLGALNKMRNNLDDEANPFLGQWDELREQITEELKR